MNPLEPRSNSERLSFCAQGNATVGSAVNLPYIRHKKNSKEAQSANLRWVVIRSETLDRFFERES
jgi:hypothetical protein